MSEPELEFPEVEFVAFGKDADEREANLELVEPSPGFPTTCVILADIIGRRADTVVLDYTQAAVNIRFQIDGIWHAMPAMDRESGDYMLATVKQLAGMNYQERRARQEGNFEAKFEGKKLKCKIVSQGVKTGERVAIFTNRPKPPSDTVEDLGIRESMRSKITELFKAESGLIVSCGMPNEGLTTSWRSTLAAFDRFMRDYYVIEEKSKPEPEVINVGQIFYDKKEGQDLFSPLPQLLLREPNVLAFPEIPDGETLNRIMQIAQDNNLLIVVRVPAKHTFDALLRLMALKPDVKKMLEMMIAIVCMRSVRKLCDNCKQAFVPSPQMLAQLRIPPGRIRELYRHFAWNPEMMDEEGQPVPPCPECFGIGFKEQQGLFELLEMSDTVRKSAIQTPRLDALLNVAQQAGHVSIRDEGVVAVAKGHTSIEELQRILSK
jgi:type II secretory ATPase GspE/PulE/Tfp pilus assembly ATPase PilB-like protein